MDRPEQSEGNGGRPAPSIAGRAVTIRLLDGPSKGGRVDLALGPGVRLPPEQLLVKGRSGVLRPGAYVRVTAVPDRNGTWPYVWRPTPS